MDGFLALLPPGGIDTIDQEETMRNWFGWAGLRAPMAALALGAVVAPSVSASPVETTTTAEPTAILRPLLKYSTVGTLSVDSGTVTGDNVIGFNNIVSQDFRSPSFFSLGEFQMIPGLGDDVTVTYNNTPFSITLGVESVDGSIPVINQTPVVLTGFLNGTITGPRQSTLEATFNFDPANPPSFQVGDFLHTLTRLGPVDIAPFTTNGGRTSIQGRLESVQVPEPASIAVFLVAAVGGYGLRRRALARRGM
jgi:hypothetical protein